MLSAATSDTLALKATESYVELSLPTPGREEAKIGFRQGGARVRSCAGAAGLSGLSKRSMYFYDAHVRKLSIQSSVHPVGVRGAQPFFGNRQEEAPGHLLGARFGCLVGSYHLRPVLWQHTASSEGRGERPHTSDRLWTGHESRQAWALQWPPEQRGSAWSGARS